jgi:hypothetical protein
MPRRIDTAMRFLRRRTRRRITNLAQLLIELEHLADNGRPRRRRVSLHF